LEVFWGCFFDAFWGRRILYVENAHVLNHCIFLMDFFDFPWTANSENQEKSLEKGMKNEV